MLLLRPNAQEAAAVLCEVFSTKALSLLEACGVSMMAACNADQLGDTGIRL